MRSDSRQRSSGSVKMCRTGEANLRRSVETRKEERAQGEFMNSCRYSRDNRVREWRPEQGRDRAQETRTILTPTRVQR